jgi:SAM-dependent methyltransferase
MKERKNMWEAEIKKKDIVLDIGCWSGKRVNKFIDKCKIYGIDVDTSRFKYAPEKTRKKLFFGDITEKIPFGEKFDWIFLGEVLEHLEKDELALKNISKSLKKKGKLILSTPRKVKFFNIWDPAWVRWKLGGKERHYHYSKEELFDKLNRQGFKIKDYYTKGDILWVFFRWINVLLRYALKSKKQIKNNMKKGFCDWIILAERKNLK